MDELIKALRRFLYRDLIYVIGGAAVILSFLHLFNRLPSATLPAAYYFFGAGLAYMVGYVIQELGCLLGVVTTADYFEPNRFVQCLYCRFTREPWSSIPPFDPIEAQRDIFKDATAAELLERVVFHRQLGTTMGPCALLSAVCLFLRGWCSGQLHWRSFDMVLAAIAAALGAGLVCVGWLKGAQQIRWMHALRSQDQRLTAGSKRTG